MMVLAACAGLTSSATPKPRANRVIDAALLRGSSVADWPNFGYDLGHTGYIDQLVQSHKIQGKLLWSQHLGPIFSSPVVGINILYIASTNGYLYALKEDTGALVWRVHLNNYLTDATPALEGQVLFVAIQSTALEALNAQTGQAYWTFDTGEKIQAPPLIAGNRVLCISSTTLWVLNATSGQLMWKFHRGANGWPSTGSPTVAGSVVYVGLGTGTQLYALNLLDGHMLWSFDTTDRIVSEALVKDNSIYIATWHGMIFALDRTSGRKRWAYSLNTNHTQNVVDGVGGSMALADGRLYVGDYRGLLLCLHAGKGTIIWRYATGAQILATPVVAAGLVYIGSGDGNFYALDTLTGRPAWRYVTGEIRSSASLAYGHIYIGSLKGVVYALA
jgi:eukaryotic-like serine/threonine-protein kinase